MMLRTTLRSSPVSKISPGICSPAVARRGLQGLEVPKRTILWEFENQQSICVVNPATDERVKFIRMDDISTVQKKYLRSRNFQRHWQHDYTFEDRRRILRRFGDLLQIEKEQLARDLTLEMGKPITQSLNEITAVADRINFFLDQTEQFMQDQVMRTIENGRMVEKVAYEPLGVVLNISAWNYPYFVGANVWIPALLTGSVVLYKPSDLAILTGQHIARLMHTAGVPEDGFNLLTGKAGVAGAAVTLPIDGVFFTGSAKVGHRIQELTHKRFIKTQLEMGGKSPVYVCEDVENIQAAAAAIADGAFYNTGQSCCAVDRIYVHRNVYEQFTEAFVEEVRKFKVGVDTMDPSLFIGPVAREEQLEFFNHLTQHAQRRGAKVHLGGKRMENTNGWFWEPTVLSDCNHTMEIMHRETFGPIVPIQKINNDDDAVSLMNDCDYGLTAGVFSKSQEKAEIILRHVETGTAYWNACDRVSPYLPWTGRKNSGIGSTLGYEGIRAFLKVKAWHMRSPPS